MTNEEAIAELKEDIDFYIPINATIEDIDRESPDGIMITALEMAIEALEQQPCEDCISRKAVDTLVDELARAISDERCCISRGRNTAIIMHDILDLPPVTPRHERWIPISERLPDEMGTYLVTLDYKEHGTGVTSLWFHNAEIGWDLRVADEVTAWMPLPEPYKEESK